MTKRAIKLHEKYTRVELVEMQGALKKNPQYQSKDGSIWLLNKKGQRLHEDIGWAIYWHGAPRGNTKMARETAQKRYW